MLITYPPPTHAIALFGQSVDLVRGDKLGWAASTFMRYVTPSKDEMDTE